MRELLPLTPERLKIAEERLRNPAPGSRIEAAKKYGIGGVSATLHGSAICTLHTDIGKIDLPSEVDGLGGWNEVSEKAQYAFLTAVP